MKTMEVFHVAFEEQPQLVATLTVENELEDALDIAFRLTQNVESSWVDDAHQEGSPVKLSSSVLALNGCRSTAVGDYIRLVDEGGAETFWRCAPAGWRQIMSRDELLLVREAAMTAAYRMEAKD